MQIVPSKELDPLDRSKKEDKSGKSESIDKQVKSQKNSSSTPVLDNTDAKLSTGRMTLRMQRTIDGFNDVFSTMKNGYNESEQNEALKKIISNTRFQNERVLDDYTPQLREIVQDKDFNRLLMLTDDTKQRLHQYAKNETISENLAAVESKNPESLVQEIAAQLRRGKLPELKIERSRIMDLLK